MSSVTKAYMRLVITDRKKIILQDVRVAGTYLTMFAEELLRARTCTINTTPIMLAFDVSTGVKYFWKRNMMIKSEAKEATGGPIIYMCHNHTPNLDMGQSTLE